MIMNNLLIKHLILTPIAFSPCQFLRFHSGINEQIQMVANWPKSGFGQNVYVDILPHIYTSNTLIQINQTQL